MTWALCIVGSLIFLPVSRVFLEHSETREPVGACLHFGSGRVLLINAQLFPEENHPVSGQFIDWLGINRVSLTTGVQTIPDEIPIEVQVREDGKIRILLYALR